MVQSRPSSEAINRAYQRMVAGEPDAPADLVELLLEPLIKRLQQKFLRLPDPDLYVDAAIDALFRLVQEPQRFHPDRGSLWNYLLMDALGDLRNAWRKECRRLHREQPLDPVAHNYLDGKHDVEETILRKLAPDGVPEGINREALLEQIQQRLSQQDWQILLLMVQGERRSTVYAQMLGITDVSPADQRRQVKQVKDRLRLMLKRLGATFNEA